MGSILSKLLSKVVYEKRYFKITAWIVIIGILLMVIFYPIIDANFLYYSRAKKRIEILKEVSSIDKDDLENDERIQHEYNSILSDMDKQKENYSNSLVQQENNKRNNIIKGISASWIFVVIAIIAPFTKEGNTGRRFTKSNWLVCIFCIAIAGIFGYIGIKMPNIISLGVNIILYNILSIFLIYTISKSGK